MSSKILIIGLGYVGLSQAILLHKKNSIHILDTNEEKIKLINANKSPLNEKEYIDYFSTNKVELRGFSNKENIDNDYSFILICLPTDFNHNIGKLNTSFIENYIQYFIENTNSKIIIKSTIPIGFTESQIQKYSTKNIAFSPEFLREGSSLRDVMDPSRVIYGPKNSCSVEFHEVLSQSLEKNNYIVRFMKSLEAEAVKLFSNTFLAMRVAFFNELDNFSIKHELDTKKIIEGISDDERIGMFYNNPSFGFGGYCLPKDSKELSNCFIKNEIPSELINSINHSNESRKKFIADHILKNNLRSVGIYRINMKKSSNNYRDSSSVDILKILVKEKVNVVIFEPLIEDETFEGCKVEKDLDIFKTEVELIISNRVDNKILDVKDKIFSRDIFRTD